MRAFGLILLLLFSTTACSTQNVSLEGKDDPHLWLEEVEGKKALEWVEKQNKKSLDEITKTNRYGKLEKNALSILQAKDKIPYVSMRGDFLYNFWQDDKHVRGLWRRTTLSRYRKKQPQWETVLDLDKLSKKENENWVFKGAECREPQYDLCLLRLSRGGKDAVVVREFNTQTKQFVKKGFHLKEAKTWVSWMDRNRIFVATDFGKGTLTESGYPRILKVWRRGTELAQAEKVREGEASDMSVFGTSFLDDKKKTLAVATWHNFYSTSVAIYEEGKIWPVPLPRSAKILGVFAKHFIVELREDWKLGSQKWPSGSLIAVHEKVAKAQKVETNDVSLLFKQTPKSSILHVSFSKESILVNALENVTGTIYSIGFEQNKFTQPTRLPFDDKSHVTLSSVSPLKKDFFFKVSGFLNPDALYLYSTTQKKAEPIKALPGKFSSQGMVVQQKWATSRDGTKIPYFLVGKEDVMKKGKAPTLLYGYGGFEVSLTPSYKPLVGRLWLEKGGLYVMANIRGGGEFGPRWHQAALKKNRQRAYDDFIAVGEDLVSRGVTTKEKLAIQGGSNGGLLVATVMTQRPDLFKAVLCHVPLIDMLRYSQLLAGASWMGEYGDPKKKDMRKYLLSYSPYHNLSAEKEYPELFLMTSTKDDRVHPGHARKMAAKLMDLGHKNIRYYENTEGGHAASANLKQKARMRALSYEFLFRTIY